MPRQGEQGFLGRGSVEPLNIITGQVLSGSGTTPFSKEFPTGEGYHALNLRINQTVVIGTGAGAVTEGELLVIKNILLKTDRGEVLVNLPGRAIYKIAAYKKGSPPRKDAMAAASATYRVNLPIYFSDAAMNRPEDTILDTNRYRSLSMQVTMGAVTDLFTAPGTATVAFTLDAEVIKTYGLLPDDAKPYYYVAYDYRPPSDANSTTSIKFDRSPDQSIKRAYVHACSSGTAGVPWSGANADDVQDTSVIRESNRFITRDRKHEMIQEQNKNDASLESVLAGIEVFDFVLDGGISSALSTADKNELEYAWTNKAGVAANDLVTLTVEAIRTLK